MSFNLETSPLNLYLWCSHLGEKTKTCQTTLLLSQMKVGTHPVNISGRKTLTFFFFFFLVKYLSPLFVLQGSLVLINVETPNPSNYSVDFADCAKISVET